MVFACLGKKTITIIYFFAQSDWMDLGPRSCSPFCFARWFCCHTTNPSIVKLQLLNIFIGEGTEECFCVWTTFPPYIQMQQLHFMSKLVVVGNRLPPTIYTKTGHVFLCAPSILPSISKTSMRCTISILKLLWYSNNIHCYINSK